MRHFAGRSAVAIFCCGLFALLLAGCTSVTGVAPTGMVRVPEGTTELSVQGENGLLEVELADGVGELPAGKYVLHSYKIQRTDEAGSIWKIERPYAHVDDTFQVAEGETTSLDMIERLFATGYVSKNGESYTFSPLILGPFKEPVKLTRNGARAPEPKLHIRNEDGTYDRSFQFRRG